MANVHLGERFETFIAEQVRAGRFQNAQYLRPTYCTVVSDLGSLRSGDQAFPFGYQALRFL